MSGIIQPNIAAAPRERQGQLITTAVELRFNCNFTEQTCSPAAASASLDTCPATLWPPSLLVPVLRPVTCRATDGRKRPSASAKVAPATAYTYFSSKNHLIAEVYLDMVKQVPYFTDVNDPMPTRVDKALRALALVVADEPEVAAACTTALLGGSGDPAVRAVRDRIGAEIHRRITSAIGPNAEPRIVSVLEMTFFGALVNAASGAYTYHQIADHLAYAVGLIVTTEA
jgi:hypothetical protein